MSFEIPAASSDFKHKFKRVNGLRFHYVEVGQEGCPAIVLLAGYPQSWFAWRKVMGKLKDYNPSFRVIAIDLPGQGDSDKPLDGYDTETVAHRVHDLVAELDLGRYYLAAHDVGAWVAFPYAYHFEAELRAVALLDAGIPGITLPDRLPSSPEFSWKTWHFAFHAVADLPEILLTGRERPYLEWFLTGKAVDPSCFTEEVMSEYMRIFTAPGALRAGLAFYRALALSARQNRELVASHKLSVPVLGLGADHGSIPNLGGTLAPFCHKIHTETMVQCGHYQAEEQSHAVAEVLGNFFKTTL